MLRKLMTIVAVLVLLTLLAAPLVLAQVTQPATVISASPTFGPDATEYSLPSPDGSCPSGEGAFVLWSYPGNPDNGKTVCGSPDAAYLSKLTFLGRCGSPPQQADPDASTGPPDPPPPCAFGYSGSGTINAGMQQYSPSPYQSGGS